MAVVKGHLKVEGNVSADNVPGAGTVTFTDGVNSYTDSTLNVSDKDFYLSGNLAGEPVLNSRTRRPLKAALGLSANTGNFGTGSIAVITWSKVFYDEGGWTDLGADATIMTVPAGVHAVRIIGGVRWASNATGSRLFQVQKNDLALAPTPQTQIEAVSTDQTDQSLLTTIIDCKEGDTFRMRARQRSGGDLVIEANDISSFAIEEVMDGGLLE